MKRRHLLQGVGTTIGAVGFSQFGIDRFYRVQAQRYDRVLAQGNRKSGRKLALLVGINGYATSPLRGCINDVELQWELLVHRYGFDPGDIRVLTDQKPGCITEQPLQPTRHNIIETFEQHLIAQAQPDSTVVFFYSGHGSRLPDPNPLPNLMSVGFTGKLETQPNTTGLQGALVTLGKEPQYLSARSLFLLTYALAQKTKNITTCLDSCFSGASFRGIQDNNFRLKAIAADLSKSSAAEVLAMEKEDQARWMRSLNLTEEQFQALRLQGIAAGIAIGSSQYNQLSADVPFDNGTFSAGALNYTLTRYLWQQPRNESIRTVFSNISRRTHDLSTQVSSPGQAPIALAKEEPDRDRPVYLTETLAPQADAVIRSVQGDQCNYWLGGLAVSSLEGGLKGAIFEAVDAQGKPVGEIQHQSRTGFVGAGQWIKGDRTALKRGLLLREKVRSVQSDTHLRLSLDPSLRKNTAQAKMLLRSIARLTIVDSDQSVDVSLVQITPELLQQFLQVVPVLTLGKFGLFNAGASPIVGSFGPANEPLNVAIDRLTQTFKSLLAAKLLRSMGGIDLANGQTGREITVKVEVAAGSSGKQLGLYQFTPQSSITIGIQNKGDRDLYVGVVAIGGSGNLRVLFPYVDEYDSAEDRALLPSGETLNLPAKDWKFNLSKDPGLLELMVFASPTPIKTALKGLQSIARGQRGGTTTRSTGPTRDALVGDDALTTVGFLLSDIGITRRSVMDTTRTIGVNQFDLISTIIEVKAE